MAKHRTHRTHSIAFKRQVVQEYLASETLHGLARRHEFSRTLIRTWVDKYEADAFDEDAEAADTSAAPVGAITCVLPLPRRRLCHQRLSTDLPR